MRPDDVTGKVRKRDEAFGGVDLVRAERETVVKRKPFSEGIDENAVALLLKTGMAAAINIFDLHGPVPAVTETVAVNARAGLGLGLDFDSNLAGNEERREGGAASPAATSVSLDNFGRRTGTPASGGVSVTHASPHDILAPVGRVPSPCFRAGAAIAEPARVAPILVPTPTRVAIRPIAAPARVLLLAAQDSAPDFSQAASLRAPSDSARTWTRAVREPLPRQVAALQIGLDLAAPARREGFIPAGIPLSGARGSLFVPKPRLTAQDNKAAISVAALTVSR